MKDLFEVAEKCMVMLDDLGIEYGYILKWEINTRAKQRWGQCKRVVGGYTINISSRLLADDVSDKSVEDTVLHELIHTVDGCFNHGEKWKRIASQVNYAYGYNIKRCSSAEEKGIVEITEKQPKAIKHQFKCKCCGKVYSRTRESNFTKNWKDYRCGVCNGEFDKLF